MQAYILGLVLVGGSTCYALYFVTTGLPQILSNVDLLLNPDPFR